MKKDKTTQSEIASLCNTVRDYIMKKEYDLCEQLIIDSMKNYPNAPEPHNLFGILLEKQGFHENAMKHFLAARALDPTYFPALSNIKNFSSFNSFGKYAFDNSDCIIESNKL